MPKAIVSGMTRSFSVSRHHLGSPLDGVSKITRKFRITGCPGLDSNQASPEYKTEALLLGEFLQTYTKCAWNCDNAFPSKVAAGICRSLCPECSISKTKPRLFETKPCTRLYLKLLRVSKDRQYKHNEDICLPVHSSILSP